MCEYVEIKAENGLPYCKPKKQLCTLCVFGNHKMYNEIREKERSNEKDGRV